MSDFCSRCGNDLSTLAAGSGACPRCGQQRPGGPAAADPGWGPPPVVSSAGWPIAGGAQPGPDASTTSKTPPRSRLGLALGGVGVVLLVLVATFVVRGVQGTSAGAASPDDFVARLQDALTGKDPAAAIALLDPEELPGLRAFYDTAVAQARSGADIDVPGALDALTLSTTGVVHEVTYLDADRHFAKVTFTDGTIDYATDPDKFPDGLKDRMGEEDEDLPEPEQGSGDLDDLAIHTAEGTRIDPFLVLVEHDGRWFVSLAMTVGEYVVEAAGLPGGNFDDPTPPGPPAESPEAAIRTLLDATVAEANDGSDTGPPLSGLLPEAQTRAFRIYGDSFREGLGGLGVDAEAGDGDTWEGLSAECEGCGIGYDDLAVSTVTAGSLTHAVIDSLTVTVAARTCGFVDYYDDGYYDDYDDGFSYDFGDDDFTYDFDEDEFSDDPGELQPSAWTPGDLTQGPGATGVDDDCTVEELAVVWDGTCLDVETTYSPPMDWTEDQTESVCMDDELGESGLTLADFGIHDVHLVVSQERGGWVIDPVATVMDYGNTALSHLSDPKVKAALEN